MDSSSDGSFVWTDASNDTIDSVDRVNDKMNKSHSENESITVKSHKNKQQEEVSNEAVENEKQQDQKASKRKLSNGQLEKDLLGSPKKKKIKRKSDGDTDVPNTKYKKTNSKNHSKSHHESELSYDEGYLDMKVKTEQGFASPSATETKNSRGISNSHSLNEVKNSKKKTKDHPSKETVKIDKLNELDNDINEHHTKKTKKNKKSSRNIDDSLMLDDPSVGEEMEVAQPAAALLEQPTHTSQNNANVKLESESPKKKKIKREAESDIDVSTTKYKKTNGNNPSESNHDSYDEGYLDLKVKTEHSAAPSATETKNSRSKSLSNCDSQQDEDIIHRINDDNTVQKSKKKSKKHSSKDTVEIDKLNYDINEHHTEKRKKKKKKSRNNDDSGIQESEDACDPSVSEEMDLAQPAASLNAQPTHATQNNANSRKILKTISNGDTRDEDIEQEKDLPNNASNSFNVPSAAKQKRKISERIQFEDESSDTELETTQLESGKRPSTKSSKLTAFLRDNSNLKEFTSKLKTDSALTVHDEIWIIRCPKDVDINAFQNKDFPLEGKIKLNGQTYESIVDHETENLSILSTEQNNFVIKSLSVNGCFNLRKRIPKSHIQDDSMVYNNQTNFIPLPETKCRHPLFGSNYRKAMKISARVAERLIAARSSAHKKLKRHKEQRSSCPQINDHPVCSPKAELGPESSTKPDHLSGEMSSYNKKKNKKRKHSENDLPKKTKRMKHDLDSAKVWESEQAIEENLFNF